MAHGHTPTWVKSDLSPASREAFRAIDLKFHDLRHEAGVPLHHVKQLLGHASISTTDTDLNASRIHLHESMVRMDLARRDVTNVLRTRPAGESPKPDGEAETSPKSLLH